MANEWGVYAFDALIAVARALDAEFPTLGCEDTPSSSNCTSSIRARELRRQLFLTNFTGLTGRFTISQCEGVDYERNDLGVTEGTECGDRTEVYRFMQNWKLLDGSNRRLATFGFAIVRCGQS